MKATAVDKSKAASLFDTKGPGFTPRPAPPPAGMLDKIGRAVGKTVNNINDARRGVPMAPTSGRRK